MKVQQENDGNLLHRVYAALEKSQQRLASYENSFREPIAVIGMACRFPGGAICPDSFWSMLKRGDDCISDVPAERWISEKYFDSDSGAPGKMVMRRGGFLSDIDKFDAAFFGVKPDEAAAMDPQQRMMLELSWHALENAGQSPGNLVGTDTSVFTGIFNTDYTEAQLRCSDTGNINAYTSPGNNFSIVAGRVSFFLGLRGPSMAVDTACSSALIALHLACQSLRSKESSMSLVGGVNLILSPNSSIAVSKMGMLSAQGCCRSFDAAADGFVRSEGGGVLVLKRLSDAQNDGDRILALVRGSAVNQMGRSSALTAPNRIAQEEVIQKALTNAGVSGNEIGYVEAHGTGSLLGDSMEIQAIGAIYGKDRKKDRPLMIGSVKGNIGHTEAASGMAGLIKAILTLHHGEIPQNIHLDNLNPDIDLNSIPALIPRRTTAWPAWAGRRFAAVHSFGFSGSNSHCILEAPPKQIAERKDSLGPYLLCLSAKTQSALDELVNRYDQYLTTQKIIDLNSLCYTATVGRSHFNHRATIMADSPEDLSEKLKHLAWPASTVVAGNGLGRGVVVAKRSKTAFTFFEFDGVAKTPLKFLFENQKAYRDAVTRCDTAIKSVREQGFRQKQDTLIFLSQYAMAEQWRAWGIEPNLTLGLGVGEYVAACVAGVFSVEDAIRLVDARARMIEEINANSCRIEPALTTPEGASTSGAISYQSENTPAELHDSFRISSTEFARVAAGVQYAKPKIRLISASTGEMVGGTVLHGAEYWVHSASHSQDISASLEALIRYSPTCIVNIGGAALGDSVKKMMGETLWIENPSGEDATFGSLLEQLAHLYIIGANINWQAIWRGIGGGKIDAPLYPFDKQRYWIELPHGNAEYTKTA